MRFEEKYSMMLDSKPEVLGGMEMKITILAVGKVKEKFYRQAIEEFEKRLSRYCRLQIIEVADEKTPDRASTAEEAAIKEKEGERLLKHIREQDYVCALAIEGESLDSVTFAKKLEALAIDGISHVVFLIGGSLGLHEKVLKRANEKISFSKLTFPHQLMRVILLEQVYRCYRIIQGQPYHK